MQHGGEYGLDNISGNHRLESCCEACQFFACTFCPLGFLSCLVCNLRNIDNIPVNFLSDSSLLQKLGADPRAAPALKGGLTDTPAGSELFLIEVSDFHLGLRPNELAAKL